MRIDPPAKVLVTGSAGFIGFHLSRELIRRGYQVVGIDNLNNYYSVELKRDRLKELVGSPGFEFHQMDFSVAEDVSSLFDRHRFDAVAHLGAQAGVRFSIESPSAYIQSNVVGTAHLLEAARKTPARHFVYASSSSVYGMNSKLPFDESDPVDHPISLYAATKKSCELIAHTYSHLHGLPTTGLRFFTVYGPWGRPDMALFKFTTAILEGLPIDVYNQGIMRRDFTYVDDIVAGTADVLAGPAEPEQDWNPSTPRPNTSSAPYRIYNIGNHQSVELTRFIEVLEGALGKRAQLNLLPMQPGDVPETYAAIDRLHEATGYLPTTPIEVGIPKFVEWYRAYYGLAER
jgi:UDP-glucuronate 4-epimerase